MYLSVLMGHVALCVVLDVLEEVPAFPDAKASIVTRGHPVVLVNTLLVGDGHIGCV